jgi:hypothetical protein
VKKSNYQGFLMIALNLLLPYAVVGRHPSFLVFEQDWLFPFGKLSYINYGDSETIKFATPFQYYYLWFLNIIAIIWVVLGLLLTVVVMKRDDDNEHANQAIPIALSLLALQLIVTLAIIPLVFSGIRDGVIYVIPLPIPFLITILLLVNWKEDEKEEVKRKDIRVLNKPYYQVFWIIVSSLVFPCAIIESPTWIGTHNQYWIFPFGVYIHDYGQWLGLGRFHFVFEYPISYFIIIAVIWVIIGLILTAVIMKFRGSKKLTKKMFTILILLLSLQIVGPIVVILLGFQLVTYIIPLPIPFLVAILLLRRDGIQFMREPYFQGFLIFVSSLILPFAVVRFETPTQILYFSFGEYINYFDQWPWISQFYMLFYPRHSSPYFTIITVICVMIGLILAVEVMTLLESKRLTKKIFTILILLLILQIAVPIIMILLAFSSSSVGVIYIIPLPISFLIAILLLESNGITLITAKNLRGYLHSI